MKSDARKKTPAAQDAGRIRGIQLYISGKYPDEISDALGVSLRQVYRWIARYIESGIKVFAPTVRSGPSSSMSHEQLVELARIITDETPRQYKFEFSLWTLNRIKEMIRQKFNLSFSFQWVSVLLKRIGLSPQRPKIRALQQDTEWVKRWKATELPALKARAKATGAQIWFADASAVRSQEAAPRTWAPRGKTPVLEKSAKRFSVNLISAVAAHGELEFMAVSENVNAPVFVLFLQRLMDGRTTNIILVLDNSSVHKCQLVRDAVASYEGRLELVFLPPYYPDGNPDELVWAHLKKNVRATTHLTKIAFSKYVNFAMTEIQKQTEMLRNFVVHCCGHFSVASVS